MAKSADEACQAAIEALVTLIRLTSVALLEHLVETT
jgi:hypothetical protein